MNEIEKSKTTEKFLKCIAQHLSSRGDCRGIRYTVTLGCPVDKRIVTFEPIRLVFPNRYRRCGRDKVNIITHVIKEHFSELQIQETDTDIVYVDTDKMVTGVYVYELSIDKKRRRWTRIK